MILSRLIRTGHSWSEIKNYTKAQLKLFCDAAIYLEIKDRATDLIDTALANNGDEKTIKKSFNQLIGLLKK